MSAELKTSGPADGLAHDARDYLTAIAAVLVASAIAVYWGFEIGGVR